MIARDARCPFCREPCPPEDPQQVVCAACAAPHHAGCFAEGRGCAASGCAAPAARVGTELVPIDRLAALDAAGLAELRARAAKPLPVQVFLLLVLTSCAVTLGVLLPILLLQGPLTALAVFLALAAAVGGFFAIRGRPVHSPVVVRDGTRPRAEFDPIFGVVSATGWVPGVMPDQGAEERERLSHDRPAVPLEASAVPERCPTCNEALREPGEPPEPLAFCFHCGASLGAEPPPRPDPKA